MKISGIILSVVLLLCLFNGCKKDQLEKPFIRLSENSADLDLTEKQDTLIYFDVDIDAEAKIREIILKENLYGTDSLIKSVNIIPVDGFKDKYVWQYQFSKRYYRNDFTGILKIEIEFIAIDNNENQTSGLYTLTMKADYEVNFIINYQDTGIDDAVIKLGTKTNDAGNYRFRMLAGDYDYEVTKEGYKTVKGKITVDNNIQETVTLEPEETEEPVEEEGA